MTGMKGPANRLRSGDFGRFWVGQTISNLGSSFTMFALPLLVFKLTGSPVNLGITTDLARAAVVATIPVLAAVDGLSVGWVYAVAFSSATLTIAFDAAQFAAIPSRALAAGRTGR
jgi:hypothetical protein